MRKDVSYTFCLAQLIELPSSGRGQEYDIIAYCVNFENYMQN